MFLMFMRSFEEEYEDDKQRRNLKLYEEALRRIVALTYLRPDRAGQIAEEALNRGKEP